MKVILIKVDDSMEEIDVDDINKLTTNNDLQILYHWNYNNMVINCYGHINDNSIISRHKLPYGGISSIMNDDSHMYDIYGNIYIVCFKNNIMINYYISDYGYIHYIMNETYNIYASDDLDDDEVIHEDIIKDKAILQNINVIVGEYDSSDELDNDNNIY